MSLLNSISLLEINKIFSNNQIKHRYLDALAMQKSIAIENLKTTVDVDNAIIDTWDYDISKSIIRKLFTETEKYIKNRDCKYKIAELMADWKNLNLGDFEWPFPAMRFDSYVHQLNRTEITEEEKDRILSDAVIKFRRIKDINAQRNDYIEYLIFKSSKNVIPTFKNSRGVDFYINGEPFDQKVSRSVGRAFMNLYGENYRQIAIDNPNLVAKCLYEYQDEERFGFEPRLLVVYLDSDLKIEDIENSLRAVDFDNPLELNFEYTHSDNIKRIYTTYCYIILLHK